MTHTHVQPQLYAAALDMLCALVLDCPSNLSTLMRRSMLLPAIASLIHSRAAPLEASFEDATAVLAAHTLIHVVSHMITNEGAEPTQNTISTFGTLQLGSGRAGAQPGGSIACVRGPDKDLLDGNAKLVVAGGSPMGEGCEITHCKDRVVYLSLTAAAESLGVKLPLVLPVAGKDGETLLSEVLAGELR